MSSLRRMLKQGSVYTVLNILRRSISFLMVPVYTRYLLPAEYGTLELIEITATIFEMFASAGIGYAIFKFYHKYSNPNDKNRVVSSGILGSLAFYSIFGLIGILNANFLSALIFGHTQYGIYFALVFLRFFVAGGTTIVTDYLRLAERPVFYSVAILSQIILSTGLNIYFLVFSKMGVLGMVLGTVIGQVAVGVILVVWIFRKVGFHFQPQFLRQIISYGLPLVLTSFGHFIINSANRYFLQLSSTLDDVGIFSLGFRFGFMINFLIVSPFIMMWQGKMFEVANRADAKPIYQKVFTYFFLVLTFSATGMFLFSREIIKVMADQAYYEAYSVIPWIAFAFALNGVQTFFQLGMLLKNKTSYLGVSTLLVGLLALPAYHYSINFFGLNGAAIATTTLYLAFAMTSYVMSQIFYPIRLEIGRLLKIIMTAVMIMIVSQLFVVGSLLQGLILKFFLFLLMPALLFLSGFLTKEEQQQLMQLFFAKSRRGSAKYILTK